MVLLIFLFVIVPDATWLFYWSFVPFILSIQKPYLLFKIFDPYQFLQLLFRMMYLWYFVQVIYLFLFLLQG